MKQNHCGGIAEIVKASAKLVLITLALVIVSSSSLLSATIYIDPTFTGSNQNGSSSNPYNSWYKVSFVSGNSYLQKSGTTFTTNQRITISGKSNITIGAYGSGAKPKLVASGSGDHIIYVTNSNNVIVKDLEITSSGTWTSGITIMGTNASNNVINNCYIHKAGWGVRILTYSGGTKILNTKIHDILDDGIFAQNVSTIEIGYCTIYDINKKYLTNTNESYSAGDGIQITSSNNLNFNIHHNTIDHSSMGNKFCVIIWGNNYTGVIEHNTMVGNVAKGSNGLYFHSTTQPVTVRYNVFKNGGFGIITYANNLDAYYNRFSNNKVGVLVNPGYSMNARNNVFNGNTRYAVQASNGTNVTFRNNIFYLNSSPAKAFYATGYVTANNNVYSQQYPGFINGYTSLSNWRSITGNDQSSVVGNPNFVNISAEDFHLQSNSIAINKGANVNLTSDFYGGSVPQSGYPDAGLHEFSGTTNSGGTNQTPLISYQVFSVYRYVSAGSFVGKVVASDPDAGQTLTFSIVSGNTNGQFNVHPSNGHITVAKIPIPLQSFYLTVKVTDNGSPVKYAQATVRINVTSTKAGEMIALGDSIASPEDEENVALRIYPNPSHDGRFTIEFGQELSNVTVDAFDLSGNEISSITSNHSSRETLDLNESPPGTYIIRINSGTEVSTLKAVKY